MADRFGLEKIKTVGDSFMAASGLPTPRPDRAEAAAEMALEVRRLLAGRTTPEGGPLAVRIGIHTDPVVAGVIRTREFIYDLWGDTVKGKGEMHTYLLKGRRRGQGTASVAQNPVEA